MDWTKQGPAQPLRLGDSGCVASAPHHRLTSRQEEDTHKGSVNYPDQEMPKSWEPCSRDPVPHPTDVGPELQQSCPWAGGGGTAGRSGHSSFGVAASSPQEHGQTRGTLAPQRSPSGSTRKQRYPRGHIPTAALLEQAFCFGGPARPSTLTQSPPASLLWSVLERWPQRGSLREGRWSQRNTNTTACPKGGESAPWATYGGWGGAGAHP